MTELLTAAQMRAIEEEAIASGRVTGLELMERAGHGVVDAVLAEWPELAEGERRAVVLCGPGNNGGDGFVVARLLKEQGWEVEVFLFGDPERLPPDARVNFDLWTAAGTVNDAADFLGDDAVYDLMDWSPQVFVDALFGLGLSRPIPSAEAGDPDKGEDPEDEYPSAFSFWEEVPRFLYEDGTRIRSVGVDIPSGLCSDSGRSLGLVLKCDLCVTFHAMKRGHLLGDAPISTGKIDVFDIGLPRGFGPWVVPENVRAKLPCEGRVATAMSQFDVFRVAKHGGHKFDHGHALILSGGPGRTGAARLAARGALRIGAGLVTLGVPPAAQMEVASHVTAIMLARVRDAAALEALLEDQRINALCIGPGLGLSEESHSLIEVCLRSARPSVLDADALTLIARSAPLFSLLHDRCVLTPHGGEFARLFPDQADRLASEPMTGPAFSKVDAARDAAQAAGCTVLFKGPDTVIARPSGTVSIHSAAYDRAAPWLATAGAGDVLAGFIAGLMARGFAPAEAAQAAAWLHVECALQFGPGLIAEDLPEILTQVLRGL